MIQVKKIFNIPKLSLRPMDTSLGKVNVEPPWKTQSGGYSNRLKIKALKALKKGSQATSCSILRTARHRDCFESLHS
jgi:hypothetical protein